MNREFTISTSFGLLKSDSVARRTLFSIARGIGGLLEETSLSIKVPTNTTEQAVPMGGITTGKVLYISCTEPLKVTLNRVNPGEGEGFNVSEDGLFLLLDTEITTIHVSNTSGSESLMNMYLAGS